jgi:ferrous iron transport protein B
VKLTALRYGQPAKIVAIHGEDESAVRLHSLRVLPGCDIARANTAPLGDPVAYLIDGQKISLRLSDAEAVEIEILAP